jgi:hypothetical protein
MPEIKGKKGGAIAPITAAIDVRRYAPQSSKGSPLVARGSLTVFLAAAGSKQLAALGEQLAKGATGKPDPSLDKPTRTGIRVTVTHGDVVLAQDVVIPGDGRVVRLVMPYNGGELGAAGLRFNASGEIAAIAAKHVPALTPIEQAALALVPEKLRHYNLGVALPGGIALNNDEERRRQEEESRRQEQEHARQEQQAARAEAQAEAAADRAEARREAREAGGRFDVHLREITLETMSPGLSAAAMLELRRDSLLR